MRTLPPAMREKVLTAAGLFAEHGLDATKMEEIAAVTGVPKATLYYYFDGKEEILTFLFTEVLDRVAEAIAGALSTPGSASDRLAAAILAHLRVFERFPMASRALQFDLGRAARVPLIAERVDAAFVEPVRALLVEGASDGSLRPIDHPRLAALAILGAVTTTGINALTVGPGHRAGPIASGLVDLVLSGVAA
jgi:TetR/AcrR family transcriptional regulator